MGKLITFDELGTIRQKESGKKIVHCHGVFDLFHFGHLGHLESAKRYGDILVVTVTQDRYVNKGPGRPRYNVQQRAAMLAALEVTDYVAINQTERAIEPILALKPNFYVKGPDYRQTQNDITGGILRESDAVESVGGKLVFTDDEVQSSTELLNRYFNQWDEDQRAAIGTVKESASLETIQNIIETFSKLRVLVLGEPIVDTYVFCQAEGISSKSPNVSARFLSEENYAGGSLAIANHLAALGCQVTLLLPHGDEPYFKNLLNTEMHPEIVIHEHTLPGIPTPRKTRFLTPFRAQRIFELINLRADQWLSHDPNPFVDQMLQLSKNQDIVLISDFGHGVFENSVLAALKDIQAFKALNVQTNSGNLGFNPFTKHAHFDYLSIDERECRLATHDRFTSIVDLASKVIGKDVRKKTSVTLGTAGSLYFDNEGKKHLCPTFFKEVVDTTGAGDAYLAVTSLLAKMDVPGPLVPFIGNCYAGLKTRIMGNKSAVSKVDLVRTIQAVLK